MVYSHANKLGLGVLQYEDIDALAHQLLGKFGHQTATEEYHIQDVIKTGGKKTH